MMFKTHLAFALLVGMVFVNIVGFTWFYIPVLLLAGLLPDVDSGRSYIGNKWYFRPIQWFLKHRGMLHSISFCTLVSLIISLVYASLAFPFFIGYLSHLLADSVTKEGIRPFWPFRGEVRGRLKTGGKLEEILFLFFVVINFILFYLSFFGD